MSFQDTLSLENMSTLALRRMLRDEKLEYHGTKLELIDRLNELPLDDLDLLILRQKLRDRGIICRGTKTEMIDRLKESEARRINESILEVNTIKEGGWVFKV